LSTADGAEDDQRRRVRRPSVHSRSSARFRESVVVLEGADHPRAIRP
jgi:hypothetical protein